MATNSILDNLDEFSTIPTLTLHLGADILKQATFVLVEGPGDIDLFRPLVTPKATLIRSYGAKGAIERIITNYFVSDPRVIAIRDKDYQIAPISTKIFHCDHCCAEMMMVTRDIPMIAIHSNYYKGTTPFRLLRNQTLKALFDLSILRKCNDIHRWNVNFSGINIDSAYDPNLATFFNNLVTQIDTMNPTNQIDSAKMVLWSIEKHNHAFSSLSDIVNGHDFIALFVHECKRSGASKKISHDSVSRSLRSSFSPPVFKKTKLWMALHLYGGKNHLKIV
ncbi:MAG: hypothetical protein WC509_04475 [Candidatus Izemoplasmatales bacterium]